MEKAFGGMDAPLIVADSYVKPGYCMVASVCVFVSLSVCLFLQYEAD